MQSLRLFIHLGIVIVTGLLPTQAAEKSALQIDSHICENNQIISSNHALLTEDKKLYFAPRPGLVFWYDLRIEKNKVNIRVEYRRNRNNVVNWEDGPVFDVPLNHITSVDLHKQNNKIVQWQILVRPSEGKQGMLGLADTAIRKQCIE